jgi:hypothetical protein
MIGAGYGCPEHTRDLAYEEVAFDDTVGRGLSGETYRIHGLTPFGRAI